MIERIVFVFRVSYFLTLEEKKSGKKLKRKRVLLFWVLDWPKH